VSPRVKFPEDHDYKINPGVIFKLEATLGKNASEEGFKKVYK